MRHQGRLTWAAMGLVLATLLGGGGCAVVHQMIAGDGPMMPALYDGLEGKRVAVVCVMNSSSYGAESTASDIAMQVGRALKRNIKDVDVVRPEDVLDWIDNNNWNETDYLDIGTGVKADMVLAIEIEAFSLYDGQTLYKGQAATTLKVYNVENGGEIAFDYSEPDYAFPTSHGIPRTDKSEAAFKRIFVQELSEHIAKSFYSYRMAENFAKDAASYAH